MIDALWAIEEALFHRVLCWVIIVSGAFALAFLLLGINAPYGRYTTASGWGPLIPARIAWMVMETPNLYISVYFFFFAADRSADAVGSTTNRLLLALFVAHYVNRSLIYPLRTQGRPMPLTVMLMAFAFCTVNGYLQARALTKFEVYRFAPAPRRSFAGFASPPSPHSPPAALAARMRGSRPACCLAWPSSPSAGSSTTTRTARCSRCARDRTTRGTTSHAAASSSTSRRPTSSARSWSGLGARRRLPGGGGRG